MPGNKWWPAKGDAKLLSVVIFSIISSDILLNFQESIPVVPIKCLMYFLAGINNK